MLKQFIKNERTRRYAKDYFLIILGCTLLAYAVTAFFRPHNMVTGGVMGLAIIIADYSARLGWEVPMWLSVLVLNIPLFILSGFALKGESVIKSAFGSLYLSVAFYYVSFFPVPANDIMLATIFGGVFTGVAVGLVLRALATTGGSTLAGMILHNTLFKHISAPKIIFVIDAVIVLIGWVVFGPVAAMYAIVSIYITTKVMEAVLEGMHFAKAAFIVSDKTEAIAGQVIEKLDRGATELKGRGMYTRQDKNVLICVVNSKELIILKQLVSEIDAAAFVIVADVREVLGKGFKPHN